MQSVKPSHHSVFVFIASIMFCCSSLSLFGDESYIVNNDSLYNIYTSSKNDSVQIAVLVKLATNLETNSILQYKNKTVNDYLQLANLKLTDSVSIDDLAFKIDMIGVDFRNNGNYVSALKFHNWAKDIANRIDNKDLKSFIFNNIGVVYRRLDDYQLALTNHIAALKFAEETRNIKSQAVAINSIGNIQMMIGNLDESLEYFKQSLIIEQKLSNLLGIAINLNNIGNVYCEKQEHAKALEYYFLSLDVNKEINSEKGVAICYNDIGNVYEVSGEPEKALEYYLDAFIINYGLNNKHSLANSYLQVGEIYANLKQYDKALEYLRPGLKISTEIGAKAFIMNTYSALYSIMIAKKKYEDAFNYLQLSSLYHDSIINIDVRKDIARLQIKFESERKENRIALLEQNAEISILEINRQKVISLLILSAFIIALGFVIFLSYYLFNKNKTNKLLIERNRLIEKTKTELDNYSKQLLKAKQKAEHNDRTKGEFLANMSHEIRTPLNSVIGFAELLSNSVSDPQQLNHLKIIKSSGRTLLTLINDLLDLSKIEAGKFEIDYENIIIGDIFEDISQIFLHRTLEKNINLVTNISQELPETIYFSGLRLRQILFNLVGNAIKFTSKGSITITVNVKNVDLSNKINLYITIEDTGIGIHEHELQKIFEPFSQSEENKTTQGTGLGLTITKRLVEMMNGSIDIDSKEGIGTKFSIFFPDISIGEGSVTDNIKLSPVVKRNKYVNILFFTNRISDCELQNIDGVDIFEGDVITDLEKVKSVIENKNLIVICGFSTEESKNILDVFLLSEAAHKLNFIVISKSGSDIFESYSNVLWLKNSTSNKEFINILNTTINKIAFEEKSNYYFHDITRYNENSEFKEGFDIVYDKYFIPAFQSKLSGNITDFLKSLKHFANKYQSVGLKKYCLDMDNELVNFNIEEIDKLLNLFNKSYTLSIK